VQEIATEMLTVKNGWLQLSAKNFTFSAPTIRIKLTQDQAIKKIKVINCVKGKLSRKISGVNPKCPTGYKVK
jgi:hypothetical protein